MVHPTANDRWPEPRDAEIEVLLLGTYHMDNPGLDAVNVEADDVLAEKRQRELEDLAARLEPWAPDRVATEWPRERQADLDALYDAYRGVGGDPDLLDEHRRNEVVQVGCRLAERLGHDRVAAVDSPIRLDDRLEDPPDIDLREEIERAGDDLDAFDPDIEGKAAAESERLASSTVAEYLHERNREDNLHANEGMFAAGLTFDDPGEYTGVSMLTAWYERNLRMVQHLWRAADEDTDRLLFLVGAGHVHVLRHLLDRTPMFCPVSPLPMLDGDAPTVPPLEGSP